MLAVGSQLTAHGSRLKAHGSKLAAHIEAWAVFVGELSVAVYSGVWILLSEGLYQCPKHVALLSGASVFWFAVGIQASYVAYTYAAGVVSCGMSPHPFYWPAGLYGSVEEDNIVVSNHIHALLAVPAVDVGSSKGTALACGTAMYYNLVYTSFHGLWFLRVYSIIRNTGCLRTNTLRTRSSRAM